MEASVVTIKELISLKGRRALITGGLGGIGQEIALTIAELGGDLVLLDRPNSTFDHLLSQLEQFNVDVDCLECDLEQPESRKLTIDSILNSPKSLDILVNNAGFVAETGLKGLITDFDKQTLETWHRVMEVNLTAIFDLTQKLAPKLGQNHHGSIINMASIYGVDAPDYSLYEGTDMGNSAAYSSSKGGLVYLTKWLATTIAPDVRVNAISPGGVLRTQPQQFVDRYVARTPLSRMASNSDMRGAIAFLASDLSAYITGQNIVVDGGWTL